MVPPKSPKSLKAVSRKEDAIAEALEGAPEVAGAEREVANAIIEEVERTAETEIETDTGRGETRKRAKIESVGDDEKEVGTEAETEIGTEVEIRETEAGVEGGRDERGVEAEAEIDERTEMIERQTEGTAPTQCASSLIIEKDRKENRCELHELDALCSIVI